jgi:hypothetical protein
LIDFISEKDELVQSVAVKKILILSNFGQNAQYSREIAGLEVTKLNLFAIH